MWKNKSEICFSNNKLITQLICKFAERQQARLYEQTWHGILPRPWTFLHKNVNNNQTCSKNENQE